MAKCNTSRYKRKYLYYHIMDEYRSLRQFALQAGLSYTTLERALQGSNFTMETRTKIENALKYISSYIFDIV